MELPFFSLKVPSQFEGYFIVPPAPPSYNHLLLQKLFPSWFPQHHTFLVFHNKSLFISADGSPYLPDLFTMKCPRAQFSHSFPSALQSQGLNCHLHFHGSEISSPVQTFVLNSSLQHTTAYLTSLYWCLTGILKLTMFKIELLIFPPNMLYPKSFPYQLRATPSSIQTSKLQSPRTPLFL